ncbi:Ent-kaurene oxidase [Madurella mycetomatis]|uniref:Ent-kaurene oxidase n=1 Tax=Madurella mycetomatis TaxID=100816 RepID=A0A175VRF5_9PEZI|nr:Ent-kaurene oxidase [Madurella mycetomatis]
MKNTFTMVELQALVALPVLVAVYVLVRRFGTTSPDWKAGKPTIGIRKQWLSWERAALRSFSQSKQWSFEGYAKHSKANSPFIIPCVERGPVVLVPPQQIRKVYGLPENILDMWYTSNVTIQSKYTIADQDIVTHPFQINVIRNQMTRNLDVLTPAIAAELEAAFERHWGSGNEWKEFRIWDSCLSLIAGASNAAFCGAPLCHDAVFLKSLRDHGMITFLGALMISGTPDLFKPITGTIIGWACELMFHRTKRLCMPFVKERLANTAKAKEDPSFCWEAPMDGLQWIIEESYATKDPAQLDPVRVVRRLLYVNDISLHSTSFTMQNIIPDIYNFDQRDALVEALREECSTVLKEAGGVWSRDAVQKLKLVDATIRESMRLTPFASIALPRTVVDPHGISLDSPDGKFHVPRGTVIATPIDPIHHDAAIYPDPNRFNPFRFTQPGAVRSIVDVFDSGEGDRDDKQEASRGPQVKSSVTLDDRFLGFGFGKHACPGRFFALNEMKIFVAHMVLNYDVECLGKWPELTNMVWLKVPYNEGRVRVRKRQLAGTA